MMRSAEVFAQSDGKAVARCHAASPNFGRAIATPLFATRTCNTYDVAKTIVFRAGVNDSKVDGLSAAKSKLPTLGEFSPMLDLIKSWPASFDSRHVLKVFTHPWAMFYFSLGRGKPQQEVERLWYTHRGRILGSFAIQKIVQNDGTLPKLKSITGEVSEWQFKPDVWVAICPAPFRRLDEKLYYSGFRGWRYFDIAKYRGTLEARLHI